VEKLCLFAGRQDSLFKQLVAGLLNDLAKDFKMLESRALDFNDFLNEVARERPDVILLEDHSPYANNAHFMQLLISKPNLPVIVIGEDSNVLHIVRRESLPVSSSDDLIKAINLLSVQPTALS